VTLIPLSRLSMVRLLFVFFLAFTAVGSYLRAQTPAKPAAEQKLSRSERKKRLAALPQKYKDFLNDVDPIMQPSERDTFLLLESDAHRELFIEDFWLRRDPDPKTSHNEYRDRYNDALEEVQQLFKSRYTERSRVYLAKGKPDDRLIVDCRYLVPLEIWRYANIEGMGRNVTVLFHEKRSGSEFYVWNPTGFNQMENLRELLSFDGETAGVVRVFFDSDPAYPGIQRPLIYDCTSGQAIMTAIDIVQMSKSDIPRLFTAPELDEEQSRRLLNRIVIADPTKPKFDTAFDVKYPGRRGHRTSTEISLAVPTASLKTSDVAGAKFFNLDIIGEMHREEKLFENYRYRFDVPADPALTSIPVLIERFLYPGTYKSRIKVIDPNSGSESVIEKELIVPEVLSASVVTRRAEDSATLKSIEEEWRAGQTTVRILPFPAGVVSGFQRIETIIAGELVKSVEFYLDGKKLMTKRAAPYVLELDLGSVPQTRRVKVIALDAKGVVLAGDDLVINEGVEPFRVRIVSPRIAPKIQGNVRVEVEASAPEGKQIERVELYLNEARVATLFAPPYVQTIRVPSSDALMFLRAVAFLGGGEPGETEDVVMLNAPDQLEQVEVHLVELPTTVLRDDKPVQGLVQSDFQVFDAGQPVKLAKFEYVKDLPLSIGMVVDSSASMKPKLAEAQRAAGEFFGSVLKPKDQAFVVSFDLQPTMSQKWTSKLAELTAGLASLRAEESTALYDAIVFSLHNFQNVRGQKAMVLISDGRDTASKFTFDQAVEFARRSAVPIYVIAIGLRSADVESRYRLSKFAGESGGTFFSIDLPSELSRIYAAIQSELRSQYLMGFYPSAEVKPGSKWREITVQVKGGKARTIRGYYP